MGTNRFFQISCMFVFFLLLLLSNTNLLAAKWGKITDEEKQQGPPIKYPEANAIILFDNGKMEVTPEFIVLNRHVRIKVLNKAGIDEVGDISIGYYKGDKVKKIKAHTITTAGKKIKVPKKEIYRKTVGNRKIETFAFPVVDSGCILEYSYKKVSERFSELDSWYFQDEHYILSSEFNLILDPGFIYSTATLNIPNENRKAKEEFLTNMEGGAPRKSYTWKMENILPVKSEPYMGFKNNYLATLYNQLVSYKTAYYESRYITDWTDLGEKFYDIINNYVNKKKLIKSIADSLTTGLTDKASITEKIYDYVKMEYKTKFDDNNYYFTHDKLSELVNQKVGTREEKNTLLVELLKAQDIPAWPVLIGTRNNSVFMPNVYQLHQFNHIIVMAEINSNNVFLDTWMKYCPYGILPSNSRAAGGLRIENKASNIIRILAVDPTTSRIDHTKMYIDSNNIAICSTSAKYCGYDAIYFGEELEENKLKELVEDDFLERLDCDFVYDSSAVKHSESDEILLDFCYTLDEYMRALDTMIVIKPMQFRFTENPFENEKRFFPVDFSYPLFYQSICEITFNENISVLDLPKPVSLDMAGVTFSKNCMFDGSKVLINCQLTIDKPVFPPQTYQKLRKIFIDMASTSEDEVVFVNSAK